MFVLGMWYLEKERLKAKANKQGFVPGPSDRIPDVSEIEQHLPHWAISLIPLISVVGTIMVPKLLTLFEATRHISIVTFANSQPILWPSIALFGGSLIALTLFSVVRRQALKILGDGTQDAITPLMTTAAVIGFGGVVVLTSGFSVFSMSIVKADIHPLLSMFAAVTAVSGITGSASGGLQIFMSKFSETYLELGVDPNELHRLATMASGSFDSLPHCGAVIAMLSITQLTHKEAYKDVGVITVIIPSIATLCCIGLAIIF